MDRIRDYFSEERRRSYLARAERYGDFLASYKSSRTLRNENTSEFWDKRITRKYGGLLQSSIYRDKLKTIMNLLPGNSGKILDVGVGYGHLEKKLTNHKGNFQLFGVDISPLAVKRLNNLAIGEFKVAGIFKLPFKSGFFDGVLVLDILEHLPPNKVFSAYKELYRVLKKGGYIVVSVPLNEGLEQKVAQGRNPGAHLREYTPDILRAELKISKFKILLEKYLSAFRRFYAIKKFLVSVLPFQIKKPNQMIVYAKKQ